MIKVHGSESVCGRKYRYRRSACHVNCNTERIPESRKNQPQGRINIGIA